jgi:hypothetical protein
VAQHTQSKESVVPISHDRPWSPELRRAVMHARPEFFTWSRTEQECYRVRTPVEDKDQIQRGLVQELFGISGSLRDLTNEQQSRLCEVELPLHGIGEDCFWLLEWLPEGVTVLDFQTLSDYDLATYHRDEEGRKKNIAGYEGEPYRGSLSWDCAFLYMNDQFCEAILSMATRYIAEMLSEHAHDIIEALIPHFYVPGENHGKLTENGYRWDLRAAADGKEAMLGELRHRNREYLSHKERQPIEARDDRRIRGVFIRKRDVPGDPNTDFVFSDPLTLHAVRFRSFVRDCHALERPFDELVAEIASERDELDKFLRSAHEDLLKNFDPKTAKPREDAIKVFVPKAVADKFFS